MINLKNLLNQEAFLRLNCFAVKFDNSDDAKTLTPFTGLFFYLMLLWSRFGRMHFPSNVKETL